MKELLENLGNYFLDKKELTKEYKEATESQSKFLSPFLETLTKEQRDLFEDVENSQLNVLCVLCQESFEEGLHIGLQLGAFGFIK